MNTRTYDNCIANTRAFNIIMFQYLAFPPKEQVESYNNTLSQKLWYPCVKLVNFGYEPMA